MTIANSDSNHKLAFTAAGQLEDQYLTGATTPYNASDQTGRGGSGLRCTSEMAVPQHCGNGLRRRVASRSEACGEAARVWEAADAAHYC